MDCDTENTEVTDTDIEIITVSQPKKRKKRKRQSPENMNAKCTLPIKKKRKLLSDKQQENVFIDDDIIGIGDKSTINLIEPTPYINLDSGTDSNTTLTQQVSDHNLETNR